MLGSLHRRPRSKALARFLNGATGGALAPHPVPRSFRAELDVRRRELAPAPPREMEATRALYGRLDRDDLEAMEQRLDPATRDVWERASPEDRMVAALGFCLYFGVDGVAEKTGLVPDIPPDDIHAMGRGPLAAGGSTYYADLVLEALRRAGAEPGGLRRALDFGCSSGRVVRVLRAVLPDAEWHGCDPNARAIGWARAHLPGIAFDTSPQEPPLPYDSGSFDLVYAISVWSHFSESAALRWLDEMRRVVRPRGHLVLTVQGPQSIAHFARHGGWSVADLLSAPAALFSRGIYYRASFNEGGDWGVESRDWGMTFLTSEWLCANATPEWGLLWLAPGRAERNQDVAVLVRR